MKYMFSIIILICSIILSWCVKNDSNISINSITPIHQKNIVWTVFSSGDITMIYRDQQSLMWSIAYPDQKDTVVLEWNGKWIIKLNTTYHIPWVYWNIVFSGGNMIYNSLFSFSWISSGSERSYTRTYVWSEKKYRENMSFINQKTHEYGELSTVSQWEFAIVRPELWNSLQWFCRRNSDSEPIKKWEFKTIGKEKVYVVYQDDGLVDHTTTKICFVKNNNFYELKRTDTHYRKDIVDSLTFL